MLFALALFIPIINPIYKQLKTKELCVNFKDQPFLLTLQ